MEFSEEEIRIIREALRTFVRHLNHLGPADWKFLNITPKDASKLLNKINEAQ